jgi:hypothetical protein
MKKEEALQAMLREWMKLPESRQPAMVERVTSEVFCWAVN